MGRGLEDKPEWNHPSNQSKQTTPQVCHSCKQKIIAHHCIESGCPWCAVCGHKIAPEKR